MRSTVESTKQAVGGRSRLNHTRATAPMVRRWNAAGAPAAFQEAGVTRNRDHGRSGRDRLHHWRIAYASAKEVDSHLRLLCISGAIHRGNATTALQIFDEVRAITWRLLHPKA